MKGPGEQTLQLHDNKKVFLYKRPENEAYLHDPMKVGIKTMLLNFNKKKYITSWMTPDHMPSHNKL